MMWTISILTVLIISHVSAWTPSSIGNKLIHRDNLRIGLASKYSRNVHVDFLQVRGGGMNSITSLVRRQAMINPAFASLLAGSIAGACGVGVAFPLDTLKTKSQILGQGGEISTSSGGSAVMGDDVSRMNMFQLFGLIYRLEGISGFFGGVKGMMVGQALIKSVAFSANQSAIDFLTIHFASMPAAALLVSAACFAGFITSFLVTPIERVKVLMQASDTYKNEIDCFNSILENDPNGIFGVFSKGLGCTLAREIPSYGLYFLIYGLLMKSTFAIALGSVAPLVCGALTGMASWIPVYPVDVVKTLVQNSDGSDDISAIEVAKKLYEENGILAFFDGITPKMLRAAVNHSVTFYIYDYLLHALTA